MDQPDTLRMRRHARTSWNATAGTATWRNASTMHTRMGWKRGLDDALIAGLTGLPPDRVRTL